MPLKTGKYGNLTLRAPGQTIGKRVSIRRGFRMNVRRRGPTVLRLTMRKRR